MTADTLKDEKLIETSYVILYADGTRRLDSRMMAPEPTYDDFAALINPILGGDLEHVSVLFENERRDMFVDDIGQLKRLPVNKEATNIYRTAWVSTHPGCDPETLPDIRGTAVLFPSRRVWF